MNFKALFYLLIFCLLIACQKENKTTPKNLPIKDSLFIKMPIFNNLTAEYINEKRKETRNFYNSAINIDDFSGPFLVVKNGENASLDSMQDISFMGIIRRVVGDPNLSNLPFSFL